MRGLQGYPYPYLHYLIGANRFLGGSRTFPLYPGMEFGSRTKWWPDAGLRPNAHEGLDICYYLDSAGQEHQFMPQTEVPVMDVGSVIHICNDYLGQSVFIDHGGDEVWRMVSVYAHIVPHRHLKVGLAVVAGAVVGTIADTSGRKNRMPAHIHLSLMKIHVDVEPGILDWDFICSSEKRELIDPQQLIEREMLSMSPLNHWKEKAMKEK